MLAKLWKRKSVSKPRGNFPDEMLEEQLAVEKFGGFLASPDLAWRERPCRAYICTASWLRR